MIVTRDGLNSVMDFDHVIEVGPEGEVFDVHPDAGIWAPEVSISSESEPESVRKPFISGDGWSLMSGYSGQWSYAGPVMHASEFIGGKLADDILSAPGYYVAVVVTDADADSDNGDDDTAGWAIAFHDA